MAIIECVDKSLIKDRNSSKILFEVDNFNSARLGVWGSTKDGRQA